MKKTFIILVVFLLAACASPTNLEEDLEQMFEEHADLTYNFIQNHHSDYYDYYLPSDTHAIVKERSGAILSVNNYNIVMNLNISNILENKEEHINFYYDDGFFAKEYLIYQKTGLFKDYQQHQQNYALDVYKVDDDCVVVFSTAYMNYYAIVYEAEVKDAALHMLKLAKYLTIRYDEILLAYSNENKVDYQKKQVNLFETIVPKEGRLDDLIIDKDESEE